MCKSFEASFPYSGRVSYLCIIRSFELIELFSFSVPLVHVFFYCFASYANNHAACPGRDMGQ
jgi:hypothetical protein